MGGREPTVSDEEVLRLVALAPAPVVTSKDLKDKLGMTRQGANARLNSLEEEGYLRSKTVGAAAKVYWLTEAGEDIVSNEFF